MKRLDAYFLAIAALTGLALTGLPSPAAGQTVANRGGAGVTGTGYRGSYFVNGEVHVNTYGTPEATPLTTGHQDFKPSWSKTGDMLVFFRRLKDDQVVTNWITVMCIINVDGTGFHELSDGTYTDFNPTWTRDGTNTPIWNRKNPATGSFYVMQSKVGNGPGQEVALTDKSYHTWAHSCLVDGRILVGSAHPTQGWGYYLMITNAKPFANAEANPSPWYAYPRWTKDETAIVYHANKTGKGQLFLYRLKDGSTEKVSTNDNADYRYPHCEATPN
jgi:Tol biopolymer transport system component